MVGRQQLPKEVLRERRAQMRRILNLIESVADKDARTIGDSRENLVRDALELLRTGAAIASFRMTSHGDDDDLRGIDAFVYDFAGTAQPLQVKGSWVGVRNHRERHPEIPYILVDRDESVTKVAHLISRTLRIPLPAALAKIAT